MKILFVFDFHGTLAKGNEYAVLESSNASLKAHGRMERFTIEDVLRLYGRPWADYFREVCSDVSSEEVASMVAYAKTLDNYVIPKYTTQMDYATEILEEIKRRDDTTLVISNTTPEALDKYLKCIGISHLIDNTIGITKEEESTGNFDVAKYKGIKLQAYVKNRGFDKVIVVGDTDDDIKAGKVVGAIAFYFNPNGKMCSLADYSISDLRQILQFI